MYGIGKKIKDESGMILMASTMGIFIILSLLAFYLARFSITETRSGSKYGFTLHTLPHYEILGLDR